MRQFIITLSLTGSLIIFAKAINLFEHVAMFVLFGFVPGQNDPLTATQMLVIYGFVASVIVVYLLGARINRFASRVISILKRSKSLSRLRAAA